MPNAADLNAIRNCPTLQAYLTRVGAIVKNFRRFAVEAEGERGYKVTLAEIAIKDGEIAVRIGNHAPEGYSCDPTDEEKERIRDEVAAAGFPHSVPGSKNPFNSPELSGVDRNNCFLFMNASGDEVLFIQVRIEREDGGKWYRPWSYWSDALWRSMEPDGLLPLFGLDRLRSDMMFVMVHEGPKAAARVMAMIEAGTGDCPWIADLKLFAHVGWPGGANNPHRVDWGPLDNLREDAIIVPVLDHDVGGENAVREISRRLRKHTIRALMFDDGFPEAFDLGKPWPRHADWWRDGRYRGPSLFDCLFPATWATRAVRVPSSDKPTHFITDRFMKEWFWVENPGVFVHRDQVDRLRSKETFDLRVRSFSDVDATAKLLVREPTAKLDGLAYRPGGRQGVINDGGQRLINTFRPSTIKPIAGDPTPFVEFMEYFIPDEGDRRELIRWMATLACRPDVRMMYGLLLISEAQGVGKTTLAEMMAKLVGTHNASFPSEKMIVNADFNGYIARKRLVVVNEIYSGDNRKAYNVLKDKITDKSVDVNEKYEKPYTIENYAHFIACSNSLSPLKFDDDDRRFLVPRVTEAKRSPEYWNGYHAWLAGDGLGIALHWLGEQLDADLGFVVGPGEHAPSTTRKQEVIDESRSPGARLAYDLAVLARDFKLRNPATNEYEPARVILTLHDVRLWVAGKRKLDTDNPHLEKALTLRKAMKQAGLVEPTTVDGNGRRRFVVEQIDDAGTPVRGPGIKTYLVANFVIEPGQTWEDVKGCRWAPSHVWPTM